MFEAGSILPSPTEWALSSLEDSAGQKLPNSYVEFVKYANGASLLIKEFNVGGEEFSIEYFLPIIENYDNDPEGWREIGVISTQLFDRLVEDEDSTGYDLIPIASSFFGDYIVLDFRSNKNSPTVGEFLHEESGPLKPMVRKIADSFDDFLNIISRPSNN